MFLEITNLCLKPLLIMLDEKIECYESSLFLASHQIFLIYCKLSLLIFEDNVVKILALTFLNLISFGSKDLSFPLFFTNDEMCGEG